MTQKLCSLKLTDGSEYIGESIGQSKLAAGELVFTTAMVGYTETLTDPSYFGQVLVFAYPLIGNYGIPDFPKNLQEIVPGFESSRVQVSAVIVNSHSSQAFHWDSVKTLDVWLRQHQVVGISGIDTRHLIKKISQKKRILAKIIPCDATEKEKKALEFFDSGQSDVLRYVSTKKRRLLGRGKKRVAILDCGIKWNIVRQILREGCEVLLLPWDDDLTGIDCSAWFVSNGPGDPRRSGNLVERVRRILYEDSRPIMGICLGHQIICLAAGAKVIRMPYGHRGHNQPVQLVGQERGYMTTQNHGYVVDKTTLSEEWEPWFYNLNDGSLEGMKHARKPIFSVQFHPEASSGPRETSWLIKEFVQKF